MDRALLGTPYKLTSYYKGAIFHHITCLNCNNSHGHEETFYDLNVHVEGNKTLSEALFALVNPFLLNEGNQYFCDICNKKVNSPIN
jgi:ubiquitin carboxyl-terminal hydrolase 40